MEKLSKFNIVKNKAYIIMYIKNMDLVVEIHVFYINMKFFTYNIEILIYRGLSKITFIND